MSCSDGWAAINMEMPHGVPRTEYSAEIRGEVERCMALGEECV